MQSPMVELRKRSEVAAGLGSAVPSPRTLLRHTWRPAVKPAGPLPTL